MKKTLLRKLLGPCGPCLSKGKLNLTMQGTVPGAPGGDCDLISGLVGTLTHSNYQRAKVHMGEGEYLVGPGNYIKPITRLIPQWEKHHTVSAYRQTTRKFICMDSRWANVSLQRSHNHSQPSLGFRGLNLDSIALRTF